MSEMDDIDKKIKDLDTLLRAWMFFIFLLVFGVIGAQYVPSPTQIEHDLPHSQTSEMVAVVSSVSKEGE